ncbi:MAG TPA: glucosamine-6-phosphate deaminase [Verrucomicrobia bacterium]|nr:glucosamine-6-phosphate deaminase [Verrucomicrobiales bacterium]HIG84772.1 glucosamine-6-phosphate deaminase [Verrucomicrobiales bacterium]HIL54533.1 glucosamine-6-phosphate deaminase [Verrucomicrobiota bacterium]
MNIHKATNKNDLGKEAARIGIQKIKETISRQGEANIIVATGSSQFEMLSHLTNEDGIDWTKVTGFHLDEYIGIPIDHPASFRLYLWKRFVSKLPVPIKSFHFIDAELNPKSECMRLAEIIKEVQINVAFIGIGENSHIAFNDPPADFEISDPYIIVNLDKNCQQQQLGEGWFKSLDDVPNQAISMSVKQIMKSASIICSVPDKRKSSAVSETVTGEIIPSCPASILQSHSDCNLFLDSQSASAINSN